MQHLGIYELSQTTLKIKDAGECGLTANRRSHPLGM